MHTKNQLAINLLGFTLISVGCCFGQQVLKLDGSSASPSPSSSTSEVASNSGSSIETTVTPPVFAIMAPRPQPAGRKPFLWPLFGAHPETGIFAVGNINTISKIYIQNTPHEVISSNKSSLGGGFETRRYFGDNTAVGLLYTQNPSDGKLLWQGKYYIWPQMRRDLAILVTEKQDIGRFAIFGGWGPGVLVTNGYGNCGWSGNFAVVGHVGTDYKLNDRLTARLGWSWLFNESGCYGDPTCHAKPNVANDIRLGFVYKWRPTAGSVH